MAGSFDHGDDPIPLYGDATLVRVCRYDPTASTDSRYALLPNVRCESIQAKEGAEPSAAQFSYILDDTTPDANRDATEPYNADGWPTEFEVMWPLVRPANTYVVAADDRLVVLGTTGYADGSGAKLATSHVLFDGFAKLPQADIGPDSQHVSFSAAGVATRLWDTPIAGRYQRNSRTTDSTGIVTLISLPARFNPDGRPNKTADGQDWTPTEDQLAGSAGMLSFPVFLEPGLKRSPDPRSPWTLADAVAYLLATNNAEEEFVDNPDFSVLAELLKNRRPKKGSDYYDPSDSSTYDEDTITVRDYDAANKPLPQALHELLGYAGFGMRFVCEDDGDGFPHNYIEIYRKDHDGPTDPKELAFPRSDGSLDAVPVDVQSLRVAHDFHGVANRVQVETTPSRKEASFILAPAFTPGPGDGAAGSRGAFAKSALDADIASANRQKYRDFILNEGGDGAWSFADAAIKTEVPDLSFLFPNSDPDDPLSVTYTARYRPGSTHLFSKGSDGRPLKAQLAISTDYAGAEGPTLWDGSGTWQVVSGGWDLMDDRCGIRITSESPASWNVGKPKGGSGTVYPSGVVDAITAMCDPSADVKRFWLRLTTTIEGDRDIGVVAERRKASPLSYAVTRLADARDHFRRETVTSVSVFNLDLDDYDSRDDTKKAQSHADQLRAAHEFPALAGSFTVPGVCLAFQIGDRISRINGRDISLRTNAGSEQAEAASYPFIVAVTWTLGAHQSTTYQVSDRRAEAQRVMGTRGQHLA